MLYILRARVHARGFTTPAKKTLFNFFMLPAQAKVKELKHAFDRAYMMDTSAESVYMTVHLCSAALMWIHEKF